MNDLLGRAVQDRITGFSGVVTAYCEYITGCNQALVAPKIGEDGSFKDSQWFDVQRLVTEPTAKIALDNGATPGCDRAAPKR
jgi:hypothetical protein